VRPGFALDEGNAPAVAEICARLDGLPLAVELAAARVRLFSPQAMLERIGGSRVGAHGRAPLQFLTGGPRDLPARQRTLRATIEWSYDLLTPDERTLFARLSVFAGGCTLAAAEAVACRPPAAQPPNHPTAQPPTLDLLEFLVDQSLLQTSQADDELRFTMLETVREYAAERLEESGEAGDIRQRHARFYLALAEEAESKFFGRESVAWLDRLEAEHDNLRAALAWSIEEDVEVGLRLAGALGEFWYRRGYRQEGRDWLAEALAVDIERYPDLRPWRAKILYEAGTRDWGVDDIDAHISMLEESLALKQTLGDERGIAHTLRSLASGFQFKPEVTRAVSLRAQSITLFRQLDDRSGLAMALLAHGRYAATYEYDYPTAHASVAEALGLAQDIGDLWLVAAASKVLADAAFAQGDYATAQSILVEHLVSVRETKDREQFGLWVARLGDIAYAQGHYESAGCYWEQALRPLQESGDARSAAFIRGRLGLVAMHRGRLEEARGLLTEALVQHQEVGFTREIVSSVAEWAGLALSCGQPERAARLLGASEAILEANGLLLPPLSRVIYERNVAAVRAQLDEARFRAAWAEGRAMTLEQAVAYALEQGSDL
jgi:tetratricopeptide (TPR) repeat protein